MLQSLTDEAAVVEEDLREAEAKNRLYALLLERTRREHMAIDQQARLPTRSALSPRRPPSMTAGDVRAGRRAGHTGSPCCRLARRALAPPQVRDKQESKRNCREDLRNLGQHLNAARGAKELTERDLQKARRPLRPSTPRLRVHTPAGSKNCGTGGALGLVTRRSFPA